MRETNLGFAADDRFKTTEHLTTLRIDAPKVHTADESSNPWARQLDVSSSFKVELRRSPGHSTGRYSLPPIESRPSSLDRMDLQPTQADSEGRRGL